MFLSSYRCLSYMIIFFSQTKDHHEIERMHEFVEKLKRHHWSIYLQVYILLSITVAVYNSLMFLIQNALFYLF